MSLFPNSPVWDYCCNESEWCVVCGVCVVCVCLCVCVCVHACAGGILIFHIGEHLWYMDTTPSPVLVSWCLNG